MGNFKNLRIWQESIKLVKEIYKVTQHEKFKTDYSLKDQIRRSSVSISSNIAEGEESGFVKKKLYFLNIAKGSAAEVITQIIIAKEVGYINQPELEKIENSTHKIIASIRNFIKITEQRKHP